MRLPILLSLFACFFAINRRDFSGSDSQRKMTWGVAARAAFENPVIGIGPDGFEEYFRRNKPDGFGGEIAANAHNDLLQIFATAGIGALVAYLYLSWSAFKSLSGPELGAISALFVNAKFSPVPLEAMVLGAVLCGKWGNPVALDIPAKAGILALAGLIAIITGPVIASDFYAHRGGIDGFRQALNLNPYELTYRTGFLRAAAHEFNRSKDPGLKYLLATEMLVEARKAERYRQNSEVTKSIIEFGAGVEKAIAK